MFEDRRHEPRWSEADLDDALGQLLYASPVEPESLTRVKILIDLANINASNQSGHDSLFGPVQLRDTVRRDELARTGRGRRRTGLLVAASMLAVGLAVSIPAIFQPSSSPAAAQAGAPLSPAACSTHNRAAPHPAITTGPPQTSPGGSANTSWYSAGKTNQLTDALHAALPAGTCVFEGSGWGDLIFGGGLQPGDGLPHVGSQDAQAAGRLVTPAGDGNLMVSMFRATGPDACITGAYDRKLTTADGTVIWQQTGSATSPTTTWIVLEVTAYRPDGTCSMFHIADERLGADDTPTHAGMTATGSPPLSIAELTTLATAPGLDTNPQN